MCPRSGLDQTAPHFSLPQRLITDPSTQTDALEDLPATPRNQSAHLRLDPYVVEEDAWDDEDAAPLTNLRQNQPPRRQTGSGSRITFRKFLLLAVIFFGVLGAMLATAGGGPVLNLLSNAFHTASPSALPSASPSNASAALVNGEPVAQRVRPITQANNDAGYDSQAQHDTWWASACSAAVFTELAKAWGITNVSVGKVLDRLLAHDPPYISISDGLLTADGWGWMASAYHMRAQVAKYAFTYDEMVQRVKETGVPIILNMKGGNVNSPWGHFVVLVGGDSTQAQIVDSSLWRITSLPRSFFDGPTSGIISDPIWWNGITIVLTAA